MGERSCDLWSQMAHKFLVPTSEMYLEYNSFVLSRKVTVGV